MIKLPNHLGGHMNKTHVDVGVAEYIIKKFDIINVLDIGCGPGNMEKVFAKNGVTWTGIDGDYRLKKPNMVIHDYTIGPIYNMLDNDYDLCWSVEFLEHVDERYLINVMRDFKRCRRIVVTAARPGAGGHHHVNCRGEDYWIGAFASIGFAFNYDETQIIKSKSTMEKHFMRDTGMFFERY